MTAHNANTVVLWEGPSRLDGKPLVALAAGLKSSSTNTKTGGMVQTYIMRSDVDPWSALATGDDVSICGPCKHRPQRTEGVVDRRKRSCYVTVARAPKRIYQAYKNDRYSRCWDAEMFAGRKVRIGAYGDPEMVPASIWASVLSLAAGWTGYTHQWRNRRLGGESLKYCQISADSAADAIAAHENGYGSFRVLADGELPLDFEERCPASAEMGKVTTCEECMKCDGSGHNIVIDVHGAGKKHLSKRAVAAAQLFTLKRRSA